MTTAGTYRIFNERSAHQRGITLIEIMIVLAIIGLLVLLLPSQIRQARKSDLRGDAARLAAAMRSGYDRAAATAVHHRLILDLEADTFQLEKCDKPIKMVRSVDEEHAAEAQAIALQAATPPDAPPAIDPNNVNGAAGGAPIGPAIVDTVGASAAPLPCSPVKGELGQVQPLSRKAGISFKQAFVAHLEEPAENGKVSINFFPLGRGERAVVTLTDKEDHVYSVRLSGLTGMAKVTEGEYRRPEEIVDGTAETEGTR
jgi:prepilin-type N-terminal cleavage/methylation domain-containing protein